MPRVRFGLVHVLNCLYSSSVTNYCVGGGYKSNVYIEGCAFTSSKAKNTPWKNYATSGSKKKKK
jgi:pectate lyase